MGQFLHQSWFCLPMVLELEQIALQNYSKLVFSLVNGLRTEVHTYCIDKSTEEGSLQKIVMLHLLLFT